MKTTKRYPLTREQCVAQIAASVAASGPNQAQASFGYRNNAVRVCDGLVCYSFVESPRTPGAYREIAFCS